MCTTDQLKNHMKQFMELAMNGQSSPYCKHCEDAKTDTDYGLHGVCWNAILLNRGICIVVSPNDEVEPSDDEVEPSDDEVEPSDDEVEPSEVDTHRTRRF